MADLLTSDSREPNPSHDSLMPYILRSVLDENGIDLEFYKDAIKRFEEDDAVPALFTDSMVKISSKLGTLSMEDDYKPYVQVGNTRKMQKQYTHSGY